MKTACESNKPTAEQPKHPCVADLNSVIWGDAQHGSALACPPSSTHSLHQRQAHPCTQTPNCHVLQNAITHYGSGRFCPCYCSLHFWT